MHACANFSLLYIGVFLPRTDTLGGRKFLAGSGPHPIYGNYGANVAYSGLVIGNVGAIFFNYYIEKYERLNDSEVKCRDNIDL